MDSALHRLVAALEGRYTLGEQIGAGGMAAVYRANDQRHGREVALKVLRPELSEGLARERFLREIRVADRLTHPRILPLHDSGDAQGALWFAMPLVEGDTLRDRLNRERQLPVDDAIRFLGVASALELGCKRFMTFDSRQQPLAGAAELKIFIPTP